MSQPGPFEDSVLGQPLPIFQVIIQITGINVYLETKLVDCFDGANKTPLYGLSMS